MNNRGDHLTGYELVKGEFTAEEAREVLMSLISSKLRFHSIKNLHSYERSGKADPQSEDRIQELEQMRDRMLGVLAKANEKGEMVELQADIRLGFREKVNS